MTTNIKEVIDTLEEQRLAIEKALEALRNVGVLAGKVSPKLGKPKKAARKAMSEEGRRRIAEAQRKRWATKKRVAKKAER